jgi:hypothetical protein
MIVGEDVVQSTFAGGALDELQEDPPLRALREAKSKAKKVRMGTRWVYRVHLARAGSRHPAAGAGIIAGTALTRPLLDFLPKWLLTDKFSMSGDIANMALSSESRLAISFVSSFNSGGNIRLESGYVCWL